uniref:Uncharacterized protein n=1 Tax=Anopheles minimus TaxID=112268 RepID=A0A182W7Q8_9DIPT
MVLSRLTVAQIRAGSGHRDRPTRLEAFARTFGPNARHGTRHSYAGLRAIGIGILASSRVSQLRSRAVSTCMLFTVFEFGVISVS